MILSAHFACVKRNEQEVEVEEEEICGFVCLRCR